MVTAARNIRPVTTNEHGEPENERFARGLNAAFAWHSPPRLATERFPRCRERTPSWDPHRGGSRCREMREANERGRFNMSEMVSVVDAQRGAPGRLLDGLATKDQQAPWSSYLRELEAAYQLRFVPTGTVLTAGRVYVDLLQPCRGPFRALHGQTAGSRNRYLAQEEVPDAVWYALIEHCASVDQSTETIAGTIDLPCWRRSIDVALGERRGFAA